MTSIGNSAFSGCTGLTGVTIPDSVTSIGDDAFYGCTSLTSVTIPKNVTIFGWYVFYGCTSLTSVTIPDSVTHIDWCTFYGCTSPTSVTIGSSVTHIGMLAFSGCTSLTSVTIPSSVTYIDTSAFSECTRLTDVYYSGSESDWAAICINAGNDCLTSATIHFNSTDTDETDTGDTDTGNTETGDTGTGDTGTGDTGTGDTGTGDTDTGDTGTTHTHSYTSIVTKAATCGEDGVMTYTCECGASYTETIPATGHSWNSGTVTLKTTRYTEGEKTYTCTACGATKTETIPVLTGSDAEFLFSDVSSSNDWYYEAVYWAYDLEITKGTSDTVFSPNAGCTRAQFATFLYRLAQNTGEDVACDLTSSPFDDVIEGVTYSEYYVAILWAYDNEITNGTSATTFSPDDTIARAQAVTMLYRYEKMVNGEPSVNGSSPFDDVIEGVTYSDYYTAILWACDLGITNGNSDGGNRFDINVTCSRAMMVTFLYRYAG